MGRLLDIFHNEFLAYAQYFLWDLDDIPILLMAADGTANDSWPFGSGVPFINYKNRQMDIT